MRLEAAVDGMPHGACGYAQDDYADVYEADALIVFTERTRSTHSRGGRHVEVGLALAWGKPVLVVGPLENIFYTLPFCAHVDVWGPEVFDILCEWREEVEIERARQDDQKVACHCCGHMIDLPVRGIAIGGRRQKETVVMVTETHNRNRVVPQEGSRR